MTNPGPLRPHLRSLGWALALGLFQPAASAGQALSQTGDDSPRQGTGTISGTVLGAYEGGPLADATVRLSQHLEPGSAADAPATTAREWLTGRDGRYHFAGVEPGSYRLAIRRIGFKATTVVVILGRTADLTLSLALEVAPVHLEPVVVRGTAPYLYREPALEEAADTWRVELEQWRQ